MSKPPQSPYPPDPADDATPVTALGELVGVAVENVDWANERARGLVARRAELRRCRLTGAEALRGVRMPWDDVLQNAPLFATVLGIEIVD